MEMKYSNGKKLNCIISDSERLHLAGHQTRKHDRETDSIFPEEIPKSASFSNWMANDREHWEMVQGMIRANRVLKNRWGKRAV
jgi:hypothetical protein